MYTDELEFQLWSMRGECEWDQQIKKVFTGTFPLVV